MTLAVVTDSVADLPVDLARRWGIRTVPFFIHWDGVTFREGIDLPPEAFYARLERSETLPTTAYPGPEAYREAFLAAAEEGAEEVISVQITAWGSGAFRAASLAAEQVADRIRVHVVDSRAVSMGIGWLALLAARWAREGRTAEAILADLEAVRRRMLQLFAAPSLKYLARGGRIGRARALLGAALRLRPIITLDDQGVITAFGRATTLRQAWARMVREARRRYGTTPVRVAVVHAVREAAAREVAEELQAVLRVEELVLSTLGPALGTHAGPGTVGILVVPTAV